MSAHAMLHVDFLRLVALEGEIEPREQSVAAEGFELGPVQKIQLAALIAEEQPVAAAGVQRAAFLQEGAERSDAGAGPDHDDGDLRVGRQVEAMRGLDEDRYRRALPRALGQKARGHALAHATAQRIA